MGTIELVPMIIGGKPRGGNDGATIDAVNPGTGEVIARVPAGTAADVGDAVSAALTAYADWRRMEPGERASAVTALADLVDEHAGELADLDVADNGSPIREMSKDASAAATQMRYLAGLVREAGGREVPASFGRLNYTMRQPYGVVGRIIPFNHPLMFAAVKLAAPVLTGNTVVIKPSEYTSLSALRLAGLAEQVFPPGVVNIVTGYGQAAGDALVTHPLVRRLAFIGSADTGRAIIARSATTGVKAVTLELGGKNPLVVFPDADLDTAVAAAVRGMNFTWQGQSCGSTSRLLVHASVYGEFVDRLAAQVEALKSGSPEDPATDTGAIVSVPQLEKVLGYIELGKREGSRLVAGGTQLTSGMFAKGNFVRPALFADVDPASRLAQEEIFGPVLATMPFTGYDEALRIANSVRYGLTASVFTADLATAHRFARDVEAGYVWVNEVSQHVAGAGFGGVKDSGLGREENIDELTSYTQSKNVHVNFDG